VYTDDNGIVRFESLDNIAPLQVGLNAAMESISEAFDRNVRIWPVADANERNQLAIERPERPLYVHREDTGDVERNLGSSWEVFPDVAIDADQVVSGQLDWDRLPVRVFGTGPMTLPSQGNTVMAEVVTFPSGFFTEEPTISTASGINDPQNAFTSYAYLSKDSVEIHWVRTTSAATHQVALTAVQTL